METKKIKVGTNVVEIEIKKCDVMNFGVHTYPYSVFYNGAYVTSDTNKAKAINLARTELSRMTR